MFVIFGFRPLRKIVGPTMLFSIVWAMMKQQDCSWLLEQGKLVLIEQPCLLQQWCLNNIVTTLLTTLFMLAISELNLVHDGQLNLVHTGQLKVVYVCTWKFHSIFPHLTSLTSLPSTLTAKSLWRWDSTRYFTIFLRRIRKLQTFNPHRPYMLF